MIKRAVDVVASGLALALGSPLMLLIALLIKREDGGPVLYAGRRIGRGGRPFRMYKFRTMVVDAERRGGSSTAADDPRITRVGRVLRRYKLDELPQLLNVVRGEMSLVGPRPEVAEYVELFNDGERAILDVPPGITDWASLWNVDEGALLAGSSDPDRAYAELIRPTKVRLQLAYLQDHSLLVDLRILAYTGLRLVQRSYVPNELARLVERASKGA